MQSNTLYYSLSAMPQVLGALAAVVAAFTFFRIDALHRYMVGDGESVLRRWDEYDGLFVDKQRYFILGGRLADGVARGSVSELEAVLRELAEAERGAGLPRASSPRGLQYLYEDRFCPTQRHMNDLKFWALVAVIAASVSIMLCVLSLASVDAIAAAFHPLAPYLVLGTNIGFFTAALGFSVYLMYLGLWGKATSARDR